MTSHKIYMLSKMRHLLDQRTAIYLYKSMSLPIFDYGDIIYEGGNICKLDKLKRTQNRGLRICLQISGKIGTVNLHRQAGVAQLYIRRSSNLKKYMFLQQENKKYVINRPIQTRAHGATVYETCIPKIEKYKKGTIYRGIKLWNDLPVDERNIVTYSQYKTCQQKWRKDVTNM